MAKRIGLRRKYQAAEPRSFASALRPACIATQSNAGRTTRSHPQKSFVPIGVYLWFKKFSKKVLTRFCAF
jgi:hypothetical protein